MQLDFAKQHILGRLKEALSADLTYHNCAHTMDVYSVAQQLALEERVAGKQLQWLLTAALFHDVGFLIRAKGHEVSSCAIAQATLPAFGYSDTDIQQICKLIMATEVPQQPTNHLEEIICDADLDYLGRADFFDRSELLYEEMCNLGTVGSREAYDNAQLAFLGSHHYFTETSRRLRDKKKQENYKLLIA